jgi:hypothetical protein
MIDYILFILFLQKKIKSFKIVGEYFTPTILNNLISTNEIQRNDNPQLMVIHNQNFHETLQNINENSEWIIIYNDDIQHLTKIFKSMRSFSQEVFFNDKNFIMILHNLKPNFLNELDKHQFLPAFSPPLDEFLKTEIYETKNISKICNGTINEQLIQSISSQNEFIYIGNPINNIDILKCQMILKTQYQIIECINENNELCGHFFHNDFKEKIWIYLLSKNEMIYNFYQINKYKIKAPIKNAI